MAKEYIFNRPAEPNHNLFVPLFNRYGLDFGMHWTSLTAAFKRNLASRCFLVLFDIKKNEPLRRRRADPLFFNWFVKTQTMRRNISFTAEPNHNLFVPLFNRYGLDFGMHWTSLTAAFKRNLASRCFLVLFEIKKNEPLRRRRADPLFFYWFVKTRTMGKE